MYEATALHISIATPAASMARTLDPGMALFWEGDDACTVYRLNHGVVRAVRYDEEGNRDVIAFFKPGDIFGVPIDPTYTYTAEAVTTLRYETFSADQWNPEENGRQALLALRDAIRSEMKTAQQRLGLVAQTGSIERISGFLILFSEGSNGQTVPVTIPQLDIASFLALTPETVCRTVKKLKTLGIIAMPKRDTYIVENLKALEQIAWPH